MSTESVMPSNHLIPCHPFLLLLSIFPSIRVFSKESALCIRWPKYWSFSISPSNEYSGLISFRIEWFDLLAVQGTLKSLPQHHSSKASILQYSTFFMVQLSHPHMTSGKTVTLTIWIFIDKVMSLLFNMLSKFVIAFLPRSNCLLISWLQSPFAVILESWKMACYIFTILLFGSQCLMDCWSYSVDWWTVNIKAFFFLTERNAVYYWKCLLCLQYKGERESDIEMPLKPPLTSGSSSFPALQAHVSVAGALLGTCAGRCCCTGATKGKFLYQNLVKMLAALRQNLM